MNNWIGVIVNVAVALSWWYWGYSCAKKKYKDDSIVPIGGTFKYKGKVYECCENIDHLDGSSCRQICSREACMSGRICKASLRPDKTQVYFREVVNKSKKGLLGFINRKGGIR